MSEDGLVKAILSEDGSVLVEHPDGSYRPAPSGTDWARVDAMTDADVERAAQDDPDAPPLDDTFWASARVRHPGLPLDADVMAWFAAQGPGWQARANAVLRGHVEARKRRG